jgi:hypothetical protein
MKLYGHPCQNDKYYPNINIYYVEDFLKDSWKTYEYMIEQIHKKYSNKPTGSDAKGTAGPHLYIKKIKINT